MLTVKPVYKLLNVSDDLKWTTNTHVTTFSLIFKALLTISMVLEDFIATSFFYPSTTGPPYFYPSIFVLTHPNDGWTGLYIKLCLPPEVWSRGREGTGRWSFWRLADCFISYHFPWSIAGSITCPFWQTSHFGICNRKYKLYDPL